MTTNFDFLLQQPALPEPVAATVTAPTSTGAAASGEAILLGCGVPRPLRRDGKGDFVHQCDEALVRAAVGQVLGTIAQTPRNAGELPWRPEFGSRIHLLRHRNNDAAAEDVARAFVIQALQRWEPRVRVRAASITREGTPTTLDNNILRIRVRYDFAKTPGGAVAISGIDQTVRITAS